MAHDPDADLVEYIGSDKTVKAAPKGKRTAPAVTLEPAKLQHEAAPSIAIYTPPEEGASHPKIAREAAAERLDNAEAALNLASVELAASRAALRSAEMDEGDCLMAFLAVTSTGPTPDELLRQYAAQQLQQRADRVARGETPEAKAAPTHGYSPLDLAAAQRPRTSKQMANAPLQSSVVRRTV